MIKAMLTPNVYLDIDGVLLANEHNAARHLERFLEYVTSNYPTYWLTTHCRGDADATVAHLARVFAPRELEYAKRILPTNWTELKTEAIDFSHPFLWFDDDLFPEERAALITKNALDSWVEVDLAKDPDHLLVLIESLLKKTG